MSAQRDPAIKNGISRRRFLISTGVLLGAASCGFQGGPAPAASKSETPLRTTIKYGEAGAFKTFNPWAQTVTQSSTANQMFSRLVYRSATGEAIPDLAESWKIAPDGKSVEVKLRSGVKWQDGKPLTADDFVKMFGYLSDPALKSDAGVVKMVGLFGPVKAVRAPDPGTVVMEFSVAVPFILDILNYWYAVRFDDLTDPTFIKNPPVGTGPYKMTKFVQGQSTTYAAYPDYHVKGQPATQNFVFNVFANGSNLIADLQSGAVDGVLLANLADANAIKDNKAFYSTNSRTGMYLIMFNCAKPPFDSVAVRQAMFYSVNRTQMAAAGNFGLEQPISSPFFTDAATGYVAELVADTFNLQKARGLLDGSGIKDLKLTYPFPTTRPNTQTYGEIWQADLAKIGVQLTLQAVDEARWLDIGAGKDPNTDLVVWSTARCLLDGAVFWSTQTNYRGGAGNLSRLGYKNPILESLVAQGASEVDPAKRKATYQQLNRIVINDAYNISLVTNSQIWAWSSKLKGQNADLIGNLAMGPAKIEV